MTSIDKAILQQLEDLQGFTTVLNELIEDHQRLAGDNRLEKIQSFKLCTRVVAALQKTLKSFDEIEKEIAKSDKEKS